MKMGVKEFRERFSEIAEGSEPVLVTKNGRVVGRYAPFSATQYDKVRWAETDARFERLREDWKARTPDWRERLAAAGFDENGDPIER
jgi:antitoxin (DNA-binding transcriptional repressor) of toxin-antitoxin stability system